MFRECCPTITILDFAFDLNNDSNNLLNLTWRSACFHINPDFECNCLHVVSMQNHCSHIIVNVNQISANHSVNIGVKI